MSITCRAVFVVALMACVATGCTRSDYRRRADRDAFSLLRQKTACAPWELPGDFRVMPHPASRFYDPSCVDDPRLPSPAPKLYSYCLPELPQRDPARFGGPDTANQTHQTASAISAADAAGPSNTLQPDSGGHQEIAQTSYVSAEVVADAGPAAGAVQRLPSVAELGAPFSVRLANDFPAAQPARLLSPSLVNVSPLRRIAFYQETRGNAGNAVPPLDEPLPVPDLLPPRIDDVPGNPQDQDAALNGGADDTTSQPDGDPLFDTDPTFDWRDDADLLFNDSGVRVTKIRRDVWQSLPRKCLVRMFEFETVRTEYQRTHDRNVPDELRDTAPRMALEDIIDQAQINSRAYQSQKEALYVAALRLSLERFDYQHKFSPTGNGTDLNYTHSRFSGITQNVLGIPSQVGIEKMLNTGGDILARFANDVVLTFNGPSGFSADIGSEIFAEFSQALIQRDIRFESLTQAERDVIYAARDYARFRKQLFRDLAASYYSLILTYRGIEIASQDYFSNLRGFDQGEAEYQAGRLPRIQVDQFEQDALRSRSDLISSCNNLERALDQLKFSIGLPTEIPVNLDLTELEQLTLRDEATVSAELVRRARRTLNAERGRRDSDQIVLLNGAIDLTRRALNLLDIRRRLQQGEDVSDTLRSIAQQLSVQEAWLLVRQSQASLDSELAAEPPPPPLRLFQRRMDVVEWELRLIRRQLLLAEASGQVSDVTVREMEGEIERLVDETLDLENRLQQSIDSNQEWESAEEKAQALRERLQVVDQLVPASADLLQRVQAVRVDTTALLDAQPEDATQLRRDTIALVDQALDVTSTLVEQGAEGLYPIEIDVDDAMLTALVQRFDVMNERGNLADVWRQIKLAGDDLRSILNLNASHSIRTRSGFNRPFDFTFDDSTTRLSLLFDAPLNRRAQRNRYRVALINYNAALRNLMQLEDSIKLDVRDDLRQLQFDREQYRIAVASAALAFERVVSTRLQLRQGVQNVQARDFLESQRTYTTSLNAVASQHIGFIVDRIQLFLDMELLTVDGTGFWSELYNEEFQPQANWAPPPCAGPAYGMLPTQLWYSPEILRQLCIPFGYPEIGSCGDTGEETADEIPPPAPIDPAALETPAWSPDEQAAAADEQAEAPGEGSARP